MTNQRINPTLPETLIAAARRWESGRPTPAQTQQISGWLTGVMHRARPQDATNT
ncbi:hypothetical protein [Nocardia brasiliensis]|uniref:hypothetical protein n=1 Tax=Nocardia brasiliensis TaxID=37326 RepID=UPI0002E177FC|nr:hypothetical protein [Nocardia brasiliensis]